MFHNPVYFGEEYFDIPEMEFARGAFSPSRAGGWQRPHFAHRRSQPNQRCPRQHYSQADHQRSAMPSFLHPLMFALGDGGIYSRPPNPPPSGRRSCPNRESYCPQPPTTSQDESNPCENPLLTFVDQLLNVESTDGVQHGYSDLVTNVLDSVLQKLSNGNLQRPQVQRKWQYRVDCSGFKSDNIFVKMSNGNIIVKAIKEEKGRDGSTSTKTMEKIIPMPKNVIVKKVSCRMLPNSFLHFEGPLKAHQSPRPTKCTTTKEEKAKVDDTNKEKTDGHSFDMKVLPNGVMVFSSFPKKNGARGGAEQAEANKNVSSEEKKTTDSAGNQAKMEENKEIPISVEYSGTEKSNNEKRDDETKTDAKKEMVCKIDSNGAGAEEQRDTTNAEETASNVNVSDPTDSEKDEQIYKEDNGQYTVELVDSDEDEDAESTTSKDSEESFVLLSEKDSAQEPTEHDIDVTCVEAGDVTDSLSEAQNETEETANTERAEGNNPEINLADILNQAVPNLQNFITGMNGNISNDMKVFEPQNLAKMITETLPKLQDFIVPKQPNAHLKTETKSDTNASTFTDSSVEDKNLETNTPRDESEKEFNVRLEMPLCNPESIRVTMDDEERVLKISAEKEGSRDGAAEKINKTIEVPSSVDLSKLRCQFTDGVLSISAPHKKARETRTRNIPVNV